MAHPILRSALGAVVLAALTGCASYRVSSTVESPAPPAAGAPAAASTAAIPVLEGSVTDRKFRELGPIEVSVKKLTVFHKDPTKEQANEALVERARAMGADAVIKVTYKTGIGFTTWGYIDATGIAIKYTP